MYTTICNIPNFTVNCTAIWNIFHFILYTTICNIPIYTLYCWLKYNKKNMLYLFMHYWTIYNIHQAIWKRWSMGTAFRGWKYFLRLTQPSWKRPGLPVRGPTSLGEACPPLVARPPWERLGLPVRHPVSLWEAVLLVKGPASLWEAQAPCERPCPPVRGTGFLWEAGPPCERPGLPMRSKSTN